MKGSGFILDGGTSTFSTLNLINLFFMNNDYSCFLASFIFFLNLCMVLFFPGEVRRVCSQNANLKHLALKSSVYLSAMFLINHFRLRL